MCSAKQKKPKPENITEEIREKEAEKIAFTNHISTFTMSVISPDKRVYHPLHPLTRILLFEWSLNKRSTVKLITRHAS